MNWGERPVILLGNGARAASDAHLVEPLLGLGIPILTSWQAKDMVDNSHPLYFGSPGIYGQRCANKVLHNADTILAIGNRMSIWNVGYEGPRDDQRIVMVDIDEGEVVKFPRAEWVKQDCKDFIKNLLIKVGPPHDSFGEPMTMTFSEWVGRCREWAAEYPWVESPAHDDADGCINSYRFVDALHKYLLPDEVIVTEMGAALCSAHQVLRLKPPQRLMTSGGLGEMGCGLPAAVGASFARHKGRVLCLSTDGGMMLNLQELQTIAHHQLPVKIIVFNNAGYGMLRQTQEKAGMKLSGVNEETGVSFPNFRLVAHAFGITTGEIRTWEDFARLIPASLSCDGPCLVDYHMSPAQLFVPKLDPVYVNGRATSPSFDNMSPVL